MYVISYLVQCVLSILSAPYLYVPSIYSSSLFCCVRLPAGGG